MVDDVNSSSCHASTILFFFSRYYIGFPIFGYLILIREIGRAPPDSICNKCIHVPETEIFFFLSTNSRKIAALFRKIITNCWMRGRRKFFLNFCREFFNDPIIFPRIFSCKIQMRNFFDKISYCSRLFVNVPKCEIVTRFNGYYIFVAN